MQKNKKSRQNKKLKKVKLKQKNFQIQIYHNRQDKKLKIHFLIEITNKYSQLNLTFKIEYKFYILYYHFIG